MKQCWPGTKIPKSTGNAFDWKGKPGPVVNAKDWTYMRRTPPKATTDNKVLNIYTKARPSNASGDA